MLERHSGDPDHPRILGAFNEPTPDWLSFFFFTYFTDRDGKFQLASLRESGFDPLSRTCDFMLKEEAHHMFVGATGVGRVVQRTVELMKEHDTDDVAPVRRHRRRHAAALPQLPLQRVARPVRRRDVDQRRQLLRRRAEGPLPGGAARRRPPAARRRPATCRPWSTARDRRPATAPALAALNETLRDDYVADCQKGVDRWNRTLAEVGAALRLPHVGLQPGRRRRSPATASRPTGGVVDRRRVGRARRRTGCRPTTTGPTSQSLMTAVHEPGRMAGWIAPPATGIHAKPVDFDYVRGLSVPTAWRTATTRPTWLVDRHVDAGRRRSRRRRSAATSALTLRRRAARRCGGPSTRFAALDVRPRRAGR